MLAGLMETLAAVFGRRLRTLRDARSLTQEQLGHAAGVDYKHIGAIERGEKVPSFEAVERLAGALKVEYYELFLPDELPADGGPQAFRLALRDVDRHGTPELRRFLHQMLIAARDLDAKRGGN
jgi:transcriptional regulator with XRE-family HTH domain